LGEPSEYYSLVVGLKKGEKRNRSRLFRQLVEMQYGEMIRISAAGVLSSNIYQNVQLLLSL
jgi:excinuclease UvrABC helicase subunit UvrB